MDACAAHERQCRRICWNRRPTGRWILTAARPGTGLQERQEAPPNRALSPLGAAACDTLLMTGVAPPGGSNPSSRTENPRTRNRKPENSSDLRNAAQRVGEIPGAVEENPPPLDPALQALIDAWPTLPEALRAGIVAMVRATAGVRC